MPHPCMALAAGVLLLLSTPALAQAPADSSGAADDTDAVSEPAAAPDSEAGAESKTEPASRAKPTPDSESPPEPEPEPEPQPEPQPEPEPESGPEPEPEPNSESASESAPAPGDSPAAELRAAESKARDSEDDLNSVLNGPGVGALDKDWQLILSTSTSLSSGGFVATRPDATPVFNNDIDVGDADRLGTLTQNFDLRFQYNFEVFGEALRARARWLVSTEYTQPNSVSSERFQRFQPNDVAIDVTDMSLVKHETLGIVLGGVRFTLPTSRQSDLVDRKTELSAFATWVKPFSNGLLLFSGARLGWRLQDAFPGQCAFQETSPVAPTNPDALDGGRCDPELGQVPVNQGFATDDWVASWSVGAQYAATSKLTLSYSIAMLWTMNGRGGNDGLTNPNADPGFDIQSSIYSYGFSANYLLNELLTELAFELPFSLSGGASISAFHPMTTADNSPYLPLWYQAIDANRAAANSIQTSLNLIASY